MRLGRATSTLEPATTPVTAVVETRSRGTLPRVNLMPPEIESSRRFRRVQTGLAGMVALAVALVAVGYLLAASSVGGAQNAMTAATTEQTNVKRQTGTYKGVTDAYARDAAVQTMLTQAMGKEVRYSTFLTQLSVSMPPNIYLTNIAFSETGAAAGAGAAAAVPAPGAAAGATAVPAPGAAAGAAVSGTGTVTMSGVGRTHDDVATWLEAVAAQKGYGTPVLQASTQAATNGESSVTWSATVPMTPDALSGRYSKAGG